MVIFLCMCLMIDRTDEVESKRGYDDLKKRNVMIIA